MEETNFNNFETKQKLPNASAVMILGVLSIITCCCYGILSLLLGGVGIYLANKDTAVYNQNPSLYTNFKNIKTGKLLCIIGIVLGVIYLIYLAWLISYFGWETLQNPELLQEKMREMMGQ
ncbi:CCC motif membrane protein [Flavobacterium suncheonense]|uniref:Membrane protein n=1 Tax=Flavobacterium suncheonense GH29-5 = DSM 17707 TaxID=1121899 RepID=A0A0A2MEH3_9FLAO|nr:CCC motif membrane protein [Flavobacterium suncheonense]KGO90649.1 membrane protein [Flavobacterium suncheonense GH29-5 = DSM 17707]